MDNNNKPNLKEKKMFATGVDIPQEERIEVINILNQRLAETFDLYSQTKQAHWNVKGSDFIQLHEFFDRIAEMIFPFVDSLAERITALGGTAMGTARMAANSSELEEFPLINDGMECVQELAERYASLANKCREGIDTTEELEDIGSSDLLTEMVRDLDKALYFLEAHIQK
ncbi:MAG: DNA starvation/stationary phase protection protein Dps [Anaerolineaceae bacterium]|jgi:starvation-inducible DNA-binding protein|nr:DNA starvation/stationary phase protection protein Dps [Anaerolineaceae bacterium]